jgi:hypothetical protein
MDELLEGIGVLSKSFQPYLSFDVDCTALQMDYSQVEFGGVTHWYR